MGQVGSNTNGTTVVQPKQVGTAVDWVSVATAGFQSLGIKADGTLWCWGDNPVGTCPGNSPGMLYQIPSPDPAHGWRQVSVESQVVCAILGDGSTWCWGDDANGRVPYTGSNSAVPQRVGVFDVVKLGQDAACALAADRTRWCWGASYRGAWGDGTLALHSSATPVRIGTATWASLDLGINDTACGVHTDGSTWCWGVDYLGQVGDPSVPVPTSGIPSETRVGTSTDGVLAAVGLDSSCRLARDGSVWCWGADGIGELGDAAPVGAAIVPVAAGGPWRSIDASLSKSVAVASDGTLWSWGVDDFNVPIPLGADAPTRFGTTSGWSSVRTGEYNGCALDGSKGLWCWGTNFVGELGDGTTTARAQPVKVGSATWLDADPGRNFSCGVQTDGSLWCWGQTQTRQSLTPVLEDASRRYAAVSSGDLGYCAVASDGGLWCGPPLARVGTASWTSVSAGYRTTCGVQQDGSGWCWGDDRLGEVGDGRSNVNGTLSVPTPSRLAVGGWRTIVASPSSNDGLACGIRTDGTLWCWGFFAVDWRDQAWSALPVPAQIGTATDWASIAVGDSHACGTKTDGSAWCVGNNTSGQRGDGTAWQLAPVRVVGF
jgi:alpha-tubulin suppressor-like RCC1 family protein